MSIRAIDYASTEEILIAKALIRARLNVEPLAAYPGLEPINLTTAYRIQDCAIDHWPELIGGWKVSSPIPIDRAPQFGGSQMMGPIFSSAIRTAPLSAEVDYGVFPGGSSALEPEIIVRIGQDVPAEKLDWTIEEAGEFISDLYIGAEILSSPLRGLLQMTIPIVASDFGGNAGILVGSRLSDWQAQDRVTVDVCLEGEAVERGEVSVKDGPLASLAFVLGQAASRGRPLLAGTMVATGTMTRAHKVEPGQYACLTFHGLGEIRCRAVEERSPRELALFQGE